MSVMRFLLLVASLFCCAFPLFAQSMDDFGEVDLFGEKDDVKLSPVLSDKSPLKKTYPIPDGCDSFGFELKLVNPGSVKVQLETVGDKNKKSFTVTPSSQVLFYQAKKGEVANPPETFKNSVLRFAFPKFNIDFFATPNFKRYLAKDVNRNLLKWEELLPDALHRAVRIDLRPGEGGVVVYIDGAYGGLLAGSPQLRSVKFTGGTGAKLTNAKAYRNTQSTPEYEVVDFPRIANASAMKKATLSIKPGLTMVDGVPMIVGDGAHSSDLSLVKGQRGMDFMGEIDYYMDRTAWERYADSQQGAVPNGYYTDAYVLFALDPDAKKDRAFSFRFGRFAERGRIPGWAYTDVFLPKNDADFPSNIKKVGMVTLNGSQLPLYLGKFPIDIGVTLDIITRDVENGRRHDYLDYEFMGRRRRPGAYMDLSHRPDESKLSAVNIFGVTFKKSGIFLDLIQKEPGNVFYNDEVPETTVVVKARRPGDYAVNWRIMDTFGKTELRKGSESISFASAGEEKQFVINLAASDIGHYHLMLDVVENGVKTFSHDATFALLGKDTRLATPAESPFGSWWTPAHFGIRDPEIFMRVFHKVGIRRTCGLERFMDDNGNLPADILALMKKYKLTMNQFPWGETPPSKTEDPKAFEEFMKGKYDALVKAFPDTKYALVFHESFGDEQVPESYGEKGELTDKDKRFAQIATDVAEWFRANHPEIKLCFGNNTSSSALTAALMRGGMKTDLIDFIGIETPSQGCIPERIWQGGTQGTWIAQQVGKTWGVNLKVTGCYEFSARPDRLFACPQDQAAYYMRDALIGLAYGYETLGLSGLSNAGGWYTQTLWGTGSLCTKAPCIYPKPMLAAYAAMTRALDRIKFNPVSRDTGNLSCYAIEFERKSGDVAYALWVPKGESEVVFEFSENVDAQHIEFLGKTSNVSGKKITLTASTYPQYLIVPKKADRVAHVRTTSPQPNGNYTSVAKFENADGITLATDSASLEKPLNIGGVHHLKGTIDVKQVDDSQMGKCLEFSLKKDGKIPDISPEYAYYEFKEPLALNGTPDELGFWVNGDGGWGKIGFRIQDARGAVYCSEGDWTDFAANSYLNFKGWYFMTYPLNGEGTQPRHPQSLGADWCCITPDVKGAPVYPVKLMGMYVTLRRKMLAPAEMRDAPGVIRIKEIGTIANPEYQPKRD